MEILRTGSLVHDVGQWRIRMKMYLYLALEEIVSRYLRRKVELIACMNI